MSPLTLLVMSTPEDQRGSPSATEEVQLLFVRHENSIRTFVRALQPSLADADDVLQETFLTVSRKASTFELGTNFVAWACSIARLKVLENFRQKKRSNLLSEAAIRRVIFYGDGIPEDRVQTKWPKQLE